jgi:hypothetical protein
MISLKPATMSATTITPKDLKHDLTRGTQASLSQLYSVAITQIDLGNTSTNNKIYAVVGGQPRNWDFPLKTGMSQVIAFVIKNEETMKTVAIIKLFINLVNP